MSMMATYLAAVLVVAADMIKVTIARHSGMAMW
jgi:hypothetical protein